MRSLAVALVAWSALAGCSTGFERVPDSRPSDAGPEDRSLADRNIDASGVLDGCPVRSELIGEQYTHTADTAITVDESGIVHIAYAPLLAEKKGFRYTRQTDEGWAPPEFVSASDEIYDPTIAVTKDGVVHIIYHRVLEMYHARADTAGEPFEVTPFAEDHRGIPALAIDDAGGLHLAIAGREQVVYRHFSAGAWSEPDVLDKTVTWIKQPVGIAVWREQVAVGYCDEIGRLKVRQGKIGELFGPPVVVEQLREDRAVALDFDPAGNVHLLFADKGSAEEGVSLRYTFQKDGVFGDLVTLGRAHAYNTSFGGFDLFTRHGEQWISFVTQGSSLIGTIHGSGGKFSEPQERPYGTSYGLASAVDANGDLHLSSWKTSARRLQYLQICPP